jgi:hypothetical protein
VQDLQEHAAPGGHLLPQLRLQQGVSHAVLCSAVLCPHLSLAAALAAGVVLAAVPKQAPAQQLAVTDTALVCLSSLCLLPSCCRLCAMCGVQVGLPAQCVLGRWFHVGLQQHHMGRARSKKLRSAGCWTLPPVSHPCVC